MLLQHGEAGGGPAPGPGHPPVGAEAGGSDPHYLRAKIYSEERDLAKAAREFEQAVALRPDFAEAWSDLGEARKELGDAEGALAAFRRAVESSPEDAVAQTRLGTKLLEGGAAHEAVAHLEEAVRARSKEPVGAERAAAGAAQDGQPEKAEAAKRQLAEVLRERDEADQKLVAAIEMNNRGAELEKAGDVRGALEKYRAALELLPEHAGIRANLAVALLKLGKWQEGIAQMREALRRDPGNARIQKALETRWRRRGRTGSYYPKNKQAIWATDEHGYTRISKHFGPFCFIRVYLCSSVAHSVLVFSVFTFFIARSKPGQRALDCLARNGQREPHVAAAAETGAGDGQDAFLLQQADERDVVGDGRLGENVERALRARRS